MERFEKKAGIDYQIKIIPKKDTVLTPSSIISVNPKAFEIMEAGLIAGGELYPREQIQAVNIIVRFKEEREQIGVIYNGR